MEFSVYFWPLFNNLSLLSLKVSSLFINGVINRGSHSVVADGQHTSILGELGPDKSMESQSGKANITPAPRVPTKGPTASSTTSQHPYSVYSGMEPTGNIHLPTRALPTNTRGLLVNRKLVSGNVYCIVGSQQLLTPLGVEIVLPLGQHG